MNRSTIYDYLDKEVENLRKLFYKHGKGYHIKFVPTIWISRDSQVCINDWYVEGFYSITLLIQEIIVEDEMGNMQLHIRYKDIEYFKVFVNEVIGE